MPDASHSGAMTSHHIAVAKLLQVGASVHEIATFLSLPEPDVHASMRATFGNRRCCLEALRAGCATTSDVAKRTGIGVRVVSATLDQLAKAGKVTRRMIRPTDKARGANRLAWQYALPDGDA